LALLLREKAPPHDTLTSSKSINEGMSWLTMRLLSRIIVKRNVDLTIEGLQHMPEKGPVLIAARHVHHFYDGAILLHAIPRPVHILVALDWVKQPFVRRFMELACHMANWPIVLRDEQLREQSGRANSAYTADEHGSYLRRAVRDSVRLLRNGEALVIFPEAYTNIDAFLPFRPGLARLVTMAERDGRTQVAIVPTGLIYTHPCGRWQATLR